MKTRFIHLSVWYLKYIKRLLWWLWVINKVHQETTTESKESEGIRRDLTFSQNKTSAGNRQRNMLVSCGELSSTLPWKESGHKWISKKFFQYGNTFLSSHPKQCFSTAWCQDCLLEIQQGWYFKYQGSEHHVKSHRSEQRNWA